MRAMDTDSLSAVTGTLIAGVLFGGMISLVSCSSARSLAVTSQPPNVELNLATLNEPNANGVTKLGSPKVVDCPYGKAIEFDGKGDALFLDADPLLNLHQFTIEVIMRPDSNGPAEQRFLQMGEVNGERMMMETRVTAEGQWYLDAYIRSGDSSRTLIDKTKLHPTGAWHHAALVVNDGAMDTYVDSKHELRGHVKFSPFTKGTTSIGVRMNKVYWYQGAIYKIKITPKSLSPSNFLKY